MFGFQVRLFPVFQLYFIKVGIEPEPKFMSCLIMSLDQEYNTRFIIICLFYRMHQPLWLERVKPCMLSYQFWIKLLVLII